MPARMPNDTRLAIGDHAERCKSRSLFLDRFADPAAKDSGDCHPRRDWFNALCGKQPVASASGARREWLDRMTAKNQGQILFAQLQARLMVNMAGGVMENAGLCLDRFGLPYIPGSAVKGCARRAALAALREWCEAGGLPQHRPCGAGNVFTAACEPFDTPAAMLAAIARVFGWGDMDWSLKKLDDRFTSDFAWACCGASDILKAAAEQLAAHFGWKIEDKYRDRPWESLPGFAGGVSFLPAYPVDIPEGTQIDGTAVPALGKLELDIVTCHHRDYYASADPNAVATDTEEPVPVVFPAVAPGHVFTFALAKLRNSSADDLKRARAWLQTGLQTFGLGAKTNAGYGWFKDVTEQIRALQDAARTDQSLEAARASLQPDENLIEKLRAMKEADLRGQINPFAAAEQFWMQKDERLQLTLLHFLLVSAPDALATDKANPKSKIAKAIANLLAKFPNAQPKRP